MSDSDLIENLEPLQPAYLPPEFPGRDREKAALTEFFADPIDTSLRNLYVRGPWGVREDTSPPVCAR